MNRESCQVSCGPVTTITVTYKYLELYYFTQQYVCGKGDAACVTAYDASHPNGTLLFVWYRYSNYGTYSVGQPDYSAGFKPSSNTVGGIVGTVLSMVFSLALAIYAGIRTHQAWCEPLAPDDRLPRIKCPKSQPVQPAPPKSPKPTEAETIHTQYVPYFVMVPSVPARTSDDPQPPVYGTQV